MQLGRHVSSCGGQEGWQQHASLQEKERTGEESSLKEYAGRGRDDTATQISSLSSWQVGADR